MADLDPADECDAGKPGVVRCFGNCCLPAIGAVVFYDGFQFGGES